jgi:hypothetical protein
MITPRRIIRGIITTPVFSHSQGQQRTLRMKGCNGLRVAWVSRMKCAD